MGQTGSDQESNRIDIAEQGRIIKRTRSNHGSNRVK